jgi:protease-4
MTLDADMLVDRRRIRRQLAFWRAFAFVLAAVAIVAGIYVVGYGDDVGSPIRPHIARVTVTGVITEDEDLTELIGDLGEEAAVRGVIVAIDSPGGTTTGGEALYDALRETAAKKPMVATVGTLAASAGYMAAIAADHIVAQRTSITGSIGVYFQYGSVVPLLDKIGVSVETVKSAPLKAEPSPFSREPVPGAREMIARLVNDTYQWFVDIVAERRKLPRDVALRLADGSIYSGRQALDLKLVDAIGDEDQALAWLETRGVDKDLPVLDRLPDDSDGAFSFVALSMNLVGSIVGADVSAALQQRALDGLVSVWHPQLMDNQ